MKDNRETIGAAGNTRAPAYFTILKLGFKVSIKARDEGKEFWVAENEQIQFIGPGPLVLLGLITMRQQRGVEWKPNSEEVDNFLSTFYPEHSNSFE